MWLITQNYASFFAIQITNLIFGMNFHPFTGNRHPPCSSPMKNFVTDDYDNRLILHSPLHRVFSLATSTGVQDGERFP
jgi:hypothetical protein